MLAVYFSQALLKHLRSPFHGDCGTQNGGLVVLHVTVLLMLAFYWEMLEHYLETGLVGQGVEHWFHGVEHWSNRIFSDNLAMMAGYFIGLHYRVVVWPARVLSAAWLYVHIFVFPHSMYLHETF